MTPRTPSVYVRARNGKLYGNPSLSFAEGSISFPAVGPPILVVWLPCESEVEPILFRILGADWGRIVFGGPVIERDRIVPDGSMPPRRHPAAIFELELARRIPKPVLYDEVERYASRIHPPHVVIDLPEHPADDEEAA